MEKKKKIVLLICIVAGVAIAVAGCISPPEEVSKQELVVGISTDVDNWYLDKFPGGDARFVWSQVYETLVVSQHVVDI